MADFTDNPTSGKPNLGHKGRTKIDVNEKLFVAAFYEAEANGALENRSVLANKVAMIYNRNGLVQISASCALLRITEFGLSPVTPVGKREAKAGSGAGRAKTPVNQESFKDSLEKVEANGPKANRSILYTEVAALYNATAEVKITTSIVPLRMKEFALECKTPVGKRGATKGARISADKIRESLNEIFALTEKGEATAEMLDVQSAIVELLAEIEPQEEETHEDLVAIPHEVVCEGYETLQPIEESPVEAATV